VDVLSALEIRLFGAIADADPTSIPEAIVFELGECPLVWGTGNGT